jgi:hypothetical protein
MLSFAGTLEKTDVILKWKIAGTNNLDRFEVERSSEGVEFQTIGIVKGSVLTDEFTYTDANLTSPTAYYRLRIISKNGNIEVGPVVIIKNLSAGSLHILVAPNPATEQANLVITSSKVDVASLRIHDSYGRIVDIKSLVLSKGENKVTLNNIGRLNSGTYHVSVVVDGMPAVARMIVQK